MSGSYQIAIACMGASIILGAALSTTIAEQPSEERKGFERLPWAPPSDDSVMQEPAKLPTPMEPLGREEEPAAIELTQQTLERTEQPRLSDVDEGGMRAMTDKVLSGLPATAAKEPEAPAPTAVDGEMLDSTNRVLQALNALNSADDAGNAASTQNAAQDLRLTLSDLVARAQSQGESSDYVGQLLEEAIARRNTQVPTALQDGSGRLNTEALLASIVAAQNADQARAAASTYLSAIEAEGSQTRLDGASGGAIATSSIPSAGGQQGRFIIVKAGDTLGAIAVEAYGDALMYPRIYQANRDVLQSPNDLSIGQRLRIPN